MPLSPMPARHTLKWFFWASCVLAAFFCTRTARADAPMCDARGMSVDAPPPITPIRDARIDGISAPACRDHAAAMLRVGHRVQRGAVVADPISIEAWVKTERCPVPKFRAARASRVATAPLLKPPGHADGIFRPPRAV